MVDSGDPPSAKGVGSHRLMARKKLQSGEGKPHSCPRLGRDRLGMGIPIS